MSTASLLERIDQADAFLERLKADYGPTGLINTPVASALTSLAEVLISPTDYLGIGTHCGLANLTAFKKITSRNKPAPLPEMIERYGQTNLFGLTGWLLAKSLEELFTQSGEARHGLVFYTDYSNYTIKGLNRPLESGCRAMGMMLGKIAQTLGTTADTTAEYAQISRRSVATTAMPFAKMPGDPNGKIEMLYGIGVNEEYPPSKAAEALNADLNLPYGFALNNQTNRVAPVNWEAAYQPAADVKGECPAVSNRFFNHTWNHLIDATLALPELFPVGTALVPRSEPYVVQQRDESI